MHPAQSPSAQPKSAILIWWISWFAILTGMTVIYFKFGLKAEDARSEQESIVNFIAIGPLILSMVIRWIVLPRIPTATKALPIFIIGLASAEGCGIAGTFLGGPHRDALFALGFIGVVQFIPTFAKKYWPVNSAGFDRQGS